MYDIVSNKEICRLLALDIYDALIADIREQEKKELEPEENGSDENNSEKG